MKKPSVEDIYNVITEAIMNEYPPEEWQLDVEVLVEALQLILDTTLLAANKADNDSNGSTH